MLNDSTTSDNTAVMPLNATFVVQCADWLDLTAILDVYNQSIAGKQATANLAPVTIAERADWFEVHMTNPKRPIYVVKTQQGESSPCFYLILEFLYVFPLYTTKIDNSLK